MGNRTIREWPRLEMMQGDMASKIEFTRHARERREQIMRIQEAAETLGLTTETLRYYERVGLIGSVARSEGGQRNYTDEELEEISKITVLRRGGISVEDLTKIKLLLKENDEDEALRILTEKISECRKRIENTARALQALKGMEEEMKWA